MDVEYGGELPEEETGGEMIISNAELLERLGVCKDMAEHLLQETRSRALAIARTKIEEAILWLREA